MTVPIILCQHGYRDGFTFYFYLPSHPASSHQFFQLILLGMFLTNDVARIQLTLRHTRTLRALVKILYFRKRCEEKFLNLIRVLVCFVLIFFFSDNSLCSHWLKLKTLAILSSVRKPTSFSRACIGCSRKEIYHLSSRWLLLILTFFFMFVLISFGEYFDTILRQSFERRSSP